MGGTAATPQDTSRTSGVEAEFGGPLRGGHQTHGGRVVLPAGVSRGHGRFRIILEQNGFELAQRFHRGVGARVLVGVDHLLAPAAAHGDRDDLFGQDAVLLRGHRTLVRRHRQFVLLLTRDAVLAAQILRGLQHAAGHRIVATTGGGAAARQSVVHLYAAAGTAPAHVGGVERDVAHALRAAGDDEIVVTGGDLQTCLDDRLQARSAATVYLHAGHRHRQTRIECDHASDRRRLAVGIAVPEDDILHRFGRNAGALEQPVERGDPEVDGGQRLEHSAVAADRRPNRFADHGFAGCSQVPPAGHLEDGAGHVRRQIGGQEQCDAWRPRRARRLVPSASRPPSASQIRCGMASVIADRISPGWIALTRTPRWASSLAAALVIPTMPALAAE